MYLKKEEKAIISKALLNYTLYILNYTPYIKCSKEIEEKVTAIYNKLNPPPKIKPIKQKKQKKFGKNEDGTRFRYDKRGIKWNIRHEHFPNNAFGYRNFYYAVSEKNECYRGDSWTDCNNYIDGDEFKQ